jgi:hypothetical protein
MESGEPLARGFFLGFLTAQLVVSWISAPLCLVVVLFYVFAGDVTRKAARAGMAYLPGFVLRRVLATAPVPVPETAVFTPAAPPNFFDTTPQWA